MLKLLKIGQSTGNVLRWLPIAKSIIKSVSILMLHWAIWKRVG